MKGVCDLIMYGFFFLVIVTILWGFGCFDNDEVVAEPTKSDIVRLREVTGSLDPNDTFGDSWSLRDAIRQNQADIRVLKNQHGY